MGMFDRLLGRGAQDDSVAEPAADDAAAPGWAAIQDACRRVYPDQPSPLHLATAVKYRFGGPDPLDGIDIYRAATPRPHWHYVSYGFSDLYGEGDPAPDADDGTRPSGYGFELTFRLAADEAVDARATPPIWPAHLLQTLARYVFETGNVFAAGHHVNSDGPLTPDEPTELEALLFVEDADLGSVETPPGVVTFVQVVGITADELDAVQRWNSLSFAELLDGRHPKGVTDLGRQSLLADPQLRDAVEEGMRRDGSSQGAVYAPGVRLRRRGDDLLLEVSAQVAAELLDALPTRLPYDQPLMVLGGEHGVLFLPHESRSSWTSGTDQLEVSLAPDAGRRFCEQVRAEPGEYRLSDLPGLVVSVVAYVLDG